MYTAISEKNDYISARRECTVYPTDMLGSANDCTAGHAPHDGHASLSGVLPESYEACGQGGGQISRSNEELERCAADFCNVYSLQN